MKVEIKKQVNSAGRYGNINSKCEMYYVGTSRDFIISTNSNTVQPLEWRKHALSLRVNVVVRGVEKII
jgi:hypothetical protein